jgi:DNA invertase Pin-like site-specific DNA recombinase
MRRKDSSSIGHLVPAAEYVRMSTDDQLYSITNQQAAIREYAANHGYSIVATYADEGRSGLALKTRQALEKLLKDVLFERARFKVIWSMRKPLGALSRPGRSRPL